MLIKINVFNTLFWCWELKSVYWLLERSIIRTYVIWTWLGAPNTINFSNVSITIHIRNYCLIKYPRCRLLRISTVPPFCILPFIFYSFSKFGFQQEFENTWLPPYLFKFSFRCWYNCLLSYRWHQFTISESYSEPLINKYNVHSLLVIKYFRLTSQYSCLVLLKFLWSFLSSTIRFPSNCY